MTRRATQTRERPKDLIDNTEKTFQKLDSPLDKTKTLTMAQSQATKRVTRKGSKQLTDEERVSQVASLIRSPSPTIPSGEAEDNGPGGSPFFTPEIMQGVQEAQKKRAQMTPKERAIDIEKTRLSMGMLPMAIVRQMKSDDKKKAERDKQRANTKGSAASEPLEIDNEY